MPTPRTPLAARFWPKVDVAGPDDCWEWTASRGSSGYGHILSGGSPAKMTSSHRVAWEMANGPIPDGLHVCHTCDNRRCCNPAHLWLGTAKQNNNDCQAKGRRRVIPPRGEKSPMAKLTDSGVSEMRRRWAAGESASSLALEFGIAHGSASRVVRGIAWAHMTTLERQEIPAPTHCRHGHPWSAANTYTNPADGRRTCRSCNAACQRARAEQRRAS